MPIAILIQIDQIASKSPVNTKWVLISTRLQKPLPQTKYQIYEIYIRNNYINTDDPKFFSRHNNYVNLCLLLFYSSINKSYVTGLKEMVYKPKKNNVLLQIRC